MTGRSARWRERALLRLVAGALAAACAGVGAEGSVFDRTGPIGLAVLLALAVVAAPPPPEPAERPSTFPARLAARRTTMTAAGCVLLAAAGEPGPWRGAAAAVLLTAYLLLLDALGPERRRPRPAHTLAALAASALVLPAAFADTGAGEWSRPLALLGVVAAATGLGLALRARGREN
ncbi:hypothetical protein ACFCX4_13700 [Kitasatospora sp. NPDC056327]|uniref:hypothetical protein n=1 Tax=Kitasatospora sp. NPDC056327 TaxID=3345785 RepID=UPI0035DADCFB